MEARDFKAKFPKLFKGLGKLYRPDYVIKFKPDARPHALCTPRRVPVSLFSKVREELSQMEKMDIISKVDEATKQLSGVLEWSCYQSLMEKYVSAWIRPNLMKAS